MQLTARSMHINEGIKNCNNELWIEIDFYHSHTHIHTRALLKPIFVPSVLNAWLCLIMADIYVLRRVLVVLLLLFYTDTSNHRYIEWQTGQLLPFIISPHCMHCIR